MLEQFKIDIDAGLSAIEKTLPSKYFYDKSGDALFVEIMHLPEYYLTRAELEIFQTKTHEIVEALHLKADTYFELIELGAGDGLKTMELLGFLDKRQFNFDYFPVDISQNALDNLEQTINKKLPNVSIEKKHGDYFHVLESLKESLHPKVILFLGSNIGNMSDEIAAGFMQKLSEGLNANDKVFLGVDLIKEASIVLPAYDDSKGITAAFNLNLLARINRELDGEFDIDNFKHQPEYCETEGVAKSYLTSNVDQEVRINKLGKTFYFAEGEKISTEISRKYDDTVINKVIQNTAFSCVNKLTDNSNYFSNYILNRK